MTFTSDIYAAISEGARRSAEVIVPIVCDLLEPRTVADVGCGEGMFAREFARQGCKVTALDESVLQPHEEPFDEEHGGGIVRFRHANLAHDRWIYESVSGEPAFDLAVCLEVAEHLPPTAADTFIASLCALAPIVLFSAAIPGQGGHGHLNEQWPAYWVERFERDGFEVSGELRWHIWDSAAEPWYQQNLLVAVHRERANALLPVHAVNYGLNEMFGEHAFSDPIPVVHPTTFEYWVEIAKGRR